MIGVWLSTAAGAHALARNAIAQTRSVDEAAVELGREPGGRPFVVGADGVYVSLSHTDGAAAVAVSTLGPVGVDVELDRELAFAELARKWFTPEEARWVAGRPADFLPLWTQKEAVGKALGTGLRNRGLLRPMPLPPASGQWKPVAGLGSMAVVAWRLTGFVVAVACDAPDALATPPQLF